MVIMMVIIYRSARVRPPPSLPLFFPIYSRSSPSHPAPRVSPGRFALLYAGTGIPAGNSVKCGRSPGPDISGDTAKAKVACQDFVTLWKDADPDTPILKEAKAELAKLQ